MLGQIQFHVLRHIRHANPHAAQSHPNNSAGALTFSSIPHANRPDTTAESAVAGPPEKPERDTRVRTRQSEDHAPVEKPA